MKTAVWMCWVLFSCTGALAGEGGDVENVPVEMGVQRMKISCKGAETEDVREIPEICLAFELGLAVPVPYDLADHGNLGDQSVEAVDSTGRKLGAVAFDVGKLHTWRRGKKKVTLLKGECPVLPSPDASWIHLKGTFRLPLIREVESPVYDFSLAEGKASFPVCLAPPSEEGDGDLAVAGDAGMEEMTVSLGRQWGKEVMVEVMLWNDKEYRIASWELLDGNGKPLKTRYINDVVPGDSSRSGSGKLMMIDAGTDLAHLKIRVRYQEALDTVPIPVDIKMGLGGTVRE